MAQALPMPPTPDAFNPGVQSITQGTIPPVDASAVQPPPGAVTGSQVQSLGQDPKILEIIKQAKERQQKILAAPESQQALTMALKPDNPMPAVPVREYKSSLYAFKDLVPALAILGGSFTKTPFMTAMKAATGAMEGFNQHQDDAAEQKMKEFHEALGEWKLKNDQIRDQQNLVFDSNGNINYNALAAYGAAHGNTAMLAALQSNPDQAVKMYMDAEKSAAELSRIHAETGKYIAETDKDRQAALDARSGGLSDDAIHDAAIAYAVTGQMPSMGMGGAKQRQQILNEGARIRQESGISEMDIITGRAGMKADISSLSKLTPQYDAVTTAERTTISNMENAISLMDKGAGSNAGPVLNRWIQAGKQETGDPDVKAFNAAIYTAATEYAKAMNGITGSQPLTDSARNEVSAIISSIDSPKAIREVFEKTMKPDMANRKASYEKQLSDIKERMTNFGNKVTGDKQPDPNSAPLTDEQMEEYNRLKEQVGE